MSPTTVRATVLLALWWSTGLRACDSIVGAWVSEAARGSARIQEAAAVADVIARAALRVKAREVEPARQAVGEAIAGWARFYEKYYLSPPPGEIPAAEWRGLCDQITASIGAARTSLAAEDLPHLHAELRGAHDLIGYLLVPPPGGQPPETEAGILRFLVGALAETGGAADPLRAFLRTELGLLDRRLELLQRSGTLMPSPGGASRWRDGRARFVAALEGPELELSMAALGLAHALEGLLPGTPPDPPRPGRDLPPVVLPLMRTSVATEPGKGSAGPP